MKRREVVLAASRNRAKLALAATKTPQAPSRAALARVGARAANGVLIAEGDSWFDYPFHDVLKMLEDVHDYDVESVANKGDRVEDMAYAEGQLEAFTRRLEKVIRRGDVPRAILLSGGGNDMTGEVLATLLNHANSPRVGLNEDIVRGAIDQRLRFSYLTILEAVSSVCRKSLGKDLPIVIHGYDYPVPDGRGFLGGWGPLPGPWLQPAMNRKGYLDAQQNLALMKALIDRFNKMLALLPKVPGLGHVRHLDLRGTLQDSNYKKDWGNELHPTARGFREIADAFAAIL